MVIVLALSHARFFPIRTAFSAFAPDRHPHCSFRGLLELYPRYGPPDCSPTFCGLCREVPISPVSRTNRSPAIESNHQLFEWVLPPLVISPFGAHAKAPAPLECKSLRANVGQTLSSGNPAISSILSRTLTCGAIIRVRQ